MRNAAIAVLREIGVDTGGSNVQFAVNPADGRLVIIEMNPRVSRSSALASKATGFPIAKIAAKLAVGYTLDELAQRDHRRHPGLVRADDRLHRHQDAALHVREIPGRRAAAVDLDEIGRRGDGDRAQLRRIGAEGAALDGDRARRLRRGRDRRGRGRRARGSEGGGQGGADPPDARTGCWSSRRPTGTASRPPKSTPPAVTTPGFWSASARSSRPRSGCAATGCRPTRPALLRLKQMGFSDARLARLAGIDAGRGRRAARTVSACARSTSASTPAPPSSRR